MYRDDIGWKRRQVAGGLGAVGLAGWLGLGPKAAAADEPPETSRIRLIRDRDFPVLCYAPQYIADEFLRTEGFTDIQYVTKGSDGGPYDVIILACKAYDLDSAIESIAPAVGANTTIVPMLNGHAHFGVLDAKFGADKVAGGLARIGGMLGPNGEVLHTSP